MTHSAVSQQIRQLEQWFDCPLFERRAGGVQLTAAGLDLQRAAEDAFDLLERRCDALRRSTQPSSWPWARRPVSCPTGSSPAGAFRGRASRHPHPPADRGGRRPAEHPARRRADPGRPRLAARVGRDAAAGRGHRPGLRASLGRLSRPADVLDAPLLHTSSRPEAWQDWAGRVGVKLAPRHPGREFDHLGHMLEAAAAGLGVAIAPAVLVEAELHRGRLPRRWASSIAAPPSACAR